MRLGSLVLALSLFASVVQAQEVSPEDCTQSKTRTENAICLFPEVSDSDAVLNRTYKELMSEIATKCKVTDGTCERLQKLLKTTQFRWIQYRDNFCELEVTHFTNQDEADLNFGACVVSAAKQKVEELRILQLNLRTLYKNK